MVLELVVEKNKNLLMVIFGDLKNNSYINSMKQIYYFFAEWCPGCKTLEPVMDKISSKIYVEKINIDYESDRARSANVMSVPTVVLAENGQEIRRFVGARSYEQVLEFIR
jgi:thioredoxin 1